MLATAENCEMLVLDKPFNRYAVSPATIFPAAEFIVAQHEDGNFPELLSLPEGDRQ
jgi:hypothetical protein